MHGAEAIATASNTPLALLGLSRSMERLILYYAVRPEARPPITALQRNLQLGSASVQRDLDRLVRLGALRRIRDGRTVRFALSHDARLWGPLRALIGRVVSPASVLREALREVRGIEVALIFGSAVEGALGPDSDVDVLIVADTPDEKELYRRLAEASLLLNRQVNPVRYDRLALAKRLGDRRDPAFGFLRAVLERSFVIVAGSLSVIAPIALAAGLRMSIRPELAG